MARKRDDEIKGGVASYFTPAEPEAPTPAVSLYRRAGDPDVLIAMEEDGQAWRVPDQAGGWDARAEVTAAALGAPRGLTRLAPADERRARARLGVTVDDIGQADPVTPTTSEPTPKRKATGSTSSGKGKAAAAAEPSTRKGEGLTAQIVAYLTPAEYAALVGKAAADKRSVSFATREAIRGYLGLD